jgi:hypothetical protein
VSSLNGRVRTLERHERQAAGCTTCHGQSLCLVEREGSLPAWLDASSRCQGCGAGIKLVDRDAWDQL